MEKMRGKGIEPPKALSHGMTSQICSALKSHTFDRFVTLAY